jgi:flagellar basal-body rod modification protein FlgD
MTTTITNNAYTFPTKETTSAKASSTAKTAEIMGKEDFLTLLVAQLQNQDPLNPDDPTEFTAQLAQFSSLEQLTNLNTSMEGLTNAQVNSEKLSALNLIGKEISYNSSKFTFAGDSIELGYQLDGAATSVTLSIQDSNGKTVRTIEAGATELSAGNHFVSWDGTGLDGKPVANGNYKIVLQARAAGEGASVAAAPLIRSEATGVDLSSGMITTTSGEVLFRDIIGVTEAKTTTAAQAITSNNAVAGIVTASTTENTASTDDGQSAQDIIDSYIQQLQP